MRFGRREILVAGAALALGRLVPRALAAEKEKFEVEKTEAEWRRSLTPTQYAVLREEDTERAGTSPLDKERRPGIYHCAGCDLPVFSSETKFDSHTGWPSFWAPIDGAIATRQ